MGTDECERYCTCLRRHERDRSSVARTGRSHSAEPTAIDYSPRSLAPLGWGSYRASRPIHLLNVDRGTPTARAARRADPASATICSSKSRTISSQSPNRTT